MSEFKSREISQLNNGTRDIISAFAIKGKTKMIGSNSLRSIQYGSDYDIEAILRGASAPKLAKMIQEQYKVASQNPDLWIVDFKCGWDTRLIYDGDYTDNSLLHYFKSHSKLIPAKIRKSILSLNGENRIDAIRKLFILRWTPTDIATGSIRLIDGARKSLEDCLLDKTICKIDLLTRVGEQFVEISENYYITIDGKSNHSKIQSRDELESDLEEDIRYYSKIDSLKSLKRLFSLYQVEGNKKKMKQLITFFNSQVGQLNKIKAEIDILLAVLDQPRKPRWQDVVSNTQFIKEQISKIYEISLTSDVFKCLDNITEKNVVNTLTHLRTYFADKINAISKNYLGSIY